MKFLLTIAISTAVSATAFGADCSKTAPAECKTQEACEGLNKGDGPKFYFDKKCMVKDTAVPSNCTEVHNTGGAKGSTEGAGTKTLDGGPVIKR